MGLQTDLEHDLFERFMQERKEKEREREKWQSLVENLQNQIEILQQQLNCVAMSTNNTPKTSNMETSSAVVEYDTDEEELARETEWIRMKSRKKRKINTSPTLSPQETINPPVIEKVKKIPPPPPIIVDGVFNYQKFYDSITSKLRADTFTIKMLNGNSVKINACNDEAYRATTKMLKELSSLWHSYENKQERPIRVMAKKLPFTCTPERIVEDLKGKDFKIEEAVNKLSWKTKEPLNMFMLSFSNDEDIKKIYGIKHIMGCVVEIQPLRTAKLIPQCKRCQVYGHTHKYCSKEARCVKCTGKHLTKDCTKPAEMKPKCVLCGEAHPASYRGCMVAKEMQKMRSKHIKKTPATLPSSSSSKQQVSPPSKILPTKNSQKSYAQAAKNAPAMPCTDPNSSNNNKLDEILKFMTSFDERLKKIENSTKTAIHTAKK